MLNDIVLAGVGGQGVVLAANLLASGFLEAGYSVKQSEIHGMAQRGGSVVTFVRRGDRVYSPVIEPGKADALLAFEKLEALRFSHYVKPGGLVVYSSQEIVPTSVTSLGVAYPEDVESRLSKKDVKSLEIDAEGIATECSNPRTSNVALVGALAARLGLGLDFWNSVIERIVPRSLEANLKAFEAGYDRALR